MKKGKSQCTAYPLWLLRGPCRCLQEHRWVDDRCDSKVRSRSTRLLLVDLAGSESTAEAHDGALVGLLSLPHGNAAACAHARQR